MARSLHEWPTHNPWLDRSRFYSNFEAVLFLFRNVVFTFFSGKGMNCFQAVVNVKQGDTLCSPQWWGSTGQLSLKCWSQGFTQLWFSQCRNVWLSLLQMIDNGFLDAGSPPGPDIFLTRDAALLCATRLLLVALIFAFAPVSSTSECLAFLSTLRTISFPRSSL